MYLIIEVIAEPSTGELIQVTAYPEDDRLDFMRHMSIAMQTEQLNTKYEYFFATYSVPLMPNVIAKFVTKHVCDRISKQCGRTIEEAEEFLRRMKLVQRLS